jgi:hypothetical protein
MVVALISAAAASGCASTPAQESVVENDPELVRIHSAVEKALPAGVSLLAVRRQGDSIVIDMSEQLLAVARGGGLEDALHRVMTAASSARTSRPRVEDYRILVNGVPLEQRIP